MDILIYLAKSAAILALFYGVYRFALQNETRFNTNRHFLILGILAALILPSITFTKTVFEQAPKTTEFDPLANLIPLTQTTSESQPFVVDWWQVLLIAYAVGAFAMLIRIAVQLISLYRVLRDNPSEKKGRYLYSKVNDTIAPFSFFNYIVYNPDLHSQEELEMILKHEKVHATQWHSIDILLAHFLRAIQWGNPLSWFYKTSIEANLEYIADSETAQQVHSKKAYQLALVKASSSLPVPALTNNFYQSYIKKRIIMLNKTHSKPYRAWKFILIMPLLALFLWSFNVTEEIKYVSENPSEVASYALTETPTLQFEASSTNAHLNSIENFFAQNHPESLVRITDRRRNEDGQLINFSFETKFAGDDRFYTRFDRGPGAPFQTVYTIEPQTPGVLLVSEIGQDGVQFKITKENLELFIEGDANQGVNSSGLKTRTTAPIQKPLMGENPLYIINGKEYRKKELPRNKTMELDGYIETYNQKEGLEKYGQKGKDGVLVFNGTTTFISTEENLEPTPVTTQLTNNRVSPSEKIIKKKITKKTTEAELKNLKKELKEQYGVKLNYTTQRNDENEITAIVISYIWDDENGNFSVNDTDGIDDFFFYLDKENDNYGFYSEKSEARRAQLHEKRDELLAKRKELLAKANTQRTEQLVEAEERRERLLAKSNTMRTEQLDEAKERRKELLGEARKMREEMLDERKELRAERNNTTNRIYGSGNYQRDGNFQDQKPIFVIDGVIQTGAIAKDLQPDQIKSVNVLKDKMATDKYGDKAKNGVIEISLYKLGERIKNQGNPLTRSYVTDMLNNEGILILKDGEEISKQDFQNLDPDSITSIFTAQPEKAMEKYGDKGKEGAIVVTTKEN